MTQIATHQAQPQTSPWSALRPVILDVVVPLGAYYLLYKAVGMDLVTSLAMSSVLPAARTLVGFVRDRRLNNLAALMLVVNAVSIALSFLTGDARVMLAKDAAGGSIIGLAAVVSVLAGRPLMSSVLKPMAGRTNPAKIAAFDRLSATSPRFRRGESLITVWWAVTLLSECTVRIVGAFTLPIATMVWLSPVLLISGLCLGMLGTGKLFGPMAKMLETESADASALR